MSRKKRQRIKEVFSLRNVFSRNDDLINEKLRTFFINSSPFTLEIGCGHGDYTIEMAKLHPERNFIGIDYKGARVYAAATKAMDLNLNNAAFIVSGAEHLKGIFPGNSINEIYIPFPDPHKPKKSFKRLVDPNFLNIYKSVLKKNARVHLKTDNEELYDFALEILSAKGIHIYFSSTDIYSEKELNDYHQIQTKYERQYLSEGKTIKYICFGF